MNEEAGRLRRRLAAGLMMALLSSSAPSWADGATSTSSPSSPAGQSDATAGTSKRAPSPEDVEEARVHFQRGIEFFGEESYEAALVEFQRAYEIAPSYQILYNTGRIHAALKDYARALRDLKRYLVEGGDAIVDERRQQVQALTRSLEQKVATLDIVSDVPGAQVTVDDVPVGNAPVRGVVVNPGDRRVGATKPGYLPSTVVVTVVATEARSVKLSLTHLNQSRVIVQKSSVAPVVAWATTGVLAVGAGAAGIVALNASSKLEDRKNSEIGGGPDSFDHDAKVVKNWSLAADGLAIGAVIGVGVSTYLTFFWHSDSDAPASGPKVTGLVLTPQSAALRGAF